MSLLEETLLARIARDAALQDPRHESGVTVFGLRCDLDPSLDYATLDEVETNGPIAITETSEAGLVPTLRVINRSDRPVFLMAGEELVGAKQNRVLDVDILVAAHSEQQIPVSCVQRGRWSYTTRRFAGAVSMAPSSLRQIMSLRTQMRYQQVGSPSADQREVWSDVDRLLKVTGTRSPTSALQDAYMQHSKRLDRIVERLPAPPGCNGVIFAVNGRVESADVFDKPETLVKLWPKLLRGCALDVLGEPRGQVTLETAAAWLHGALATRVERFKSPGVGDELRLESDELVGACLVVDSKPLHLGLFAKPEPRQPRQPH